MPEPSLIDDRTAPPADRQQLTTGERRQPGDRARLVKYEPWSLPNPSLLGHCAFAGGWVMHQVPVFRRGDGSISVGVPNAAQIDSDGRIKLRDGKRDYTAVLTFETKAARERWQHLVLGVLAAAGIGGVP